MGANKNAKRAAFVHLFFNVIGTVVWLSVFCIIKAIFPLDILNDPASHMSIAVLHSVFNILCTILLLPMSQLLEKLVIKLIPDSKKEEDFVENMFVCSTHDDILFFTNFGKVYSLKGYYIPEAQRTARGRAAINLIQLSEGERVAAMIPAKEGLDGYIALATKNGLVKKTALTEFANIRKTGKIAISINEGDELVGVQFTTGQDELIIASEEGKCIRFSETDVRATGRDTQGVRGIELNEDDRLVDMAVIRPGCEILTISSTGYGKRSDIEDYRLQNRGGKGIRAGIFNDKTGKLVNLKLIEEGQDVMLIADSGIIIRIKSEEISKIGRSTQGVRIMRLTEGKIATVALAPHEDDELPEDADGALIAEGEAAPAEATEAPAQEE